VEGSGNGYQGKRFLTARQKRSRLKHVDKIFSQWLLWLMVLFPGSLGAQAVRNAVIAPHSQDLVILEGDKLVKFKPDRFLQARYTVLYFGAGWCPDCRRFSPALVSAYDRQAPDARRFEVLLLSRDKSAEAMLRFMRTEKMSWPALTFEQLVNAQDLEKFYSGHGIPCLTVIDPKGTVVLQSKSDQDAKELLQQLEQLLNKPAPTGA
jgi:thiol-disulfide isomerase/thioredoxin